MNYYSLFILQQHLEVLTNCKACSNSSSQDKLLLPNVFNLYRQDKEGKKKKAVPPLSNDKEYRQYETQEQDQKQTKGLSFFKTPNHSSHFQRHVYVTDVKKRTTIQIKKSHLFVI